MNKTTIITIIFSILLFVSYTYAEEHTIQLICKYTHTINEDGSKCRKSGEDLVTINYSDYGLAVIKKQGLEAMFIGTITDEEIHGKTKYKIQGTTIQQTILIYRSTGDFEITFKNIGSERGLTHYGTCKPLAEEKF